MGSGAKAARAGSGRPATVLLLGGADADEYLGRVTLCCLRDAGCRVDYLTDARRNLLRLSRLPRRVIEEPMPGAGEDPAPFGERLDALARERGIDVIMPTGIQSSMILARLGPSLRNAAVVPAGSAELIDELDDKWAFACLARRHGLPTPPTVLLDPAHDAAAESVPGDLFPAVIKPLRGAGGEGVFRAATRAELRNILRDKRPSGAFVVQRNVPGTDYDASALAIVGKVVAWCARSQPPEAIVEFIEGGDVVDTTRAAVAATNYSGFIDFDFRYAADGTGPLILDCNPRIWASAWMAALHGFNAPKLAVDLALGEPVSQPADYRLGPYHRHRELPARLVRSVFGGPRVSRANLRGLAYNLSDPIFMMALRLAWRRYHRRMFGT